MPWHIEKGHSKCADSKPYAVVKDSDGSVEGCHPTRAKAEDQMAALYANESSTSVPRDSLRDQEAHMTTLQETEELGGTPNPGTPKDKRLKKNKKSAEGDVVSLVKIEPVEDTSVAAEAPMWTGTLVIEGSPTGDGREFAKDAIQWADVPLPLRWQKEDSHGGMPTNLTVRVGNITRVWRDGDNIMGEGVFDLGGPEDDDAHEAYRRMGAQTLTGVSIDADDITDADIEYVFPESDGEGEEEDDLFFLLFAAPEKIIFHAARIRAATLCDIPAFVEAKIELIPEEDRQAALEAAAAIVQSPSRPHATATSDAAWDGAANESRLPDVMTSAAAVEVYAWVDVVDGADAVSKLHTRFLHHEINEDGSPGPANLTACSSGIGILSGTRGGAQIPDVDRRGVYEHLAKHLRDAGQEPPPYVETTDDDALVASSWTDWKPSTEWFQDPQLGQVMPIMVTEQGRIYGHAAQWGQCHLGYMNECIMPPFEDYHAYYRTGEVVCDDGSHIAVGAITAGIEHARLTMGAARAKEQYENTDAVVGWVATGNDRHGIWVAGVVRPDAQESRVRSLRGSGQVSPDWRRIGGELRMIGLLTVNESGYHTPRARSFVAGGQIRSLVSSGMVTVQHHSTEPTKEELDKRAMQLLREQLFARIHSTQEA